MMARISGNAPISKDEFHRRLRSFLETDSETVGESDYGGTAWVWVGSLGYRYYLNADSTRNGVAAYLDLVEEHGESLKWSAVENARGKRNKAAFGPYEETIRGFYFYRLV